MRTLIDLPKEIILEIAKISDLITALNLLRTCTALYELVNARPFWTDQLRYIYWILRPQLPFRLQSLSIPELKILATTPYRFEHDIFKEQLADLPLQHRKLDFPGILKDIKIVSGGRWAVTSSKELDPDADMGIPGGTRACVRLWTIPCSDVQGDFRCVAKLDMGPGFTPFELCLDYGDVDLDLLVFVNAYKSGAMDDGGYVKVFRINLGVETPEFSPLAHLQTNEYTTGLTIPCGKVLATIYPANTRLKKGFIWNWRTGEKVEAFGPEVDEHSWVITVSEQLSVIWETKNRSIDVHWSATSNRPGDVDHHFPGLLDCFPEAPQGLQVIVPLKDEIRTPNGDTAQVALTHLEHESILVEVEKLGTGRISFTRYAKSNAYMQTPDDPSDPFGHDMEAPLGFVQTVNGHLVDMARSGRLNAFLVTASDNKAQTTIGHSVSYAAFRNADVMTLPFICPFSGLIGHVRQDGNFYYWRLPDSSV